MLTVGVEEELLLLRPDGDVAPVAPEVTRLLHDDRVKPELMTYQVEVASRVCTNLTDLDNELLDLRRRVSAAAEVNEARLVPVAAPPFDDPGLAFLSDSDRYHDLAARFPWASAASGTCACQVHVGMDDRDLAVQVLARLRPWLPGLLALSANSPFSQGRDTGWNSLRYGRQLRWPTFVPPAELTSAEEYDRAVTRMVRTGAAFDPRSVYLMARLSPRYPTIELRVADTCLEHRDAVLLAGIVRALVASLVADVRRGAPPEVVPEQALRAELAGAARHGNPFPVPLQRSAGSGADTPGRASYAERLLQRVEPALVTSGDLETVVSGLGRWAHAGNGAARQRRLRETAPTPDGFVADLADVAVAGLSQGTTGPRVRPGSPDE